MSKIRYKYCIVPHCKSTTIKTPQKIFFSVPINEQRRTEWCLAMGRVPGKHKTLSVKCSRFVCEDHFDLEKDMDNYRMWKMVGVRKLLLKKGIIPHKLECQREKSDVKKIDIGPSLPIRGAGSEAATCHTAEVQELKNINGKRRGTALYNIGKENNNASHQDLEIAFKREVKDRRCKSKQEPNALVKGEVDDELENYTFSVRYDSDTGGEYLIRDNFS